jgi:hypothetical protein
MNIDTAQALADGRPSSPVSQHSLEDDEEEALPPSYKMAAPINEADLVALLMASPLYQKLESIKSQIERGAHKGDKKDKTESKSFLIYILLS